MNILVVGSCNMDLRYQLSHLPKEGETILAENFQVFRGGKGQNQAVCAAKLGGQVAMISALGEDDYGKSIYSSMEKEHIRLCGVKSVSQPTGTASIYVDSQGHNTIVVHSGANFSLTPEDILVQRPLFSQADFCVLQLELPLKTVYAALELCEEEQVRILLNPAPANECFDPHYYSKVDYLIPNETELCTIVGESVQNEEELTEKTEKLLQLGVKNVIVTLGEKGAYFHSAHEHFFIPAKTVHAVDTTGAGDAFIGAFVYALSQEKSIKESLEFATEVSAFTVTKKGAIDALPTQEELCAFFA